MNTHSIPVLTLVATSLVVGIASPAFSQTSTASPTLTLQRATPEAQAFALGNFAGKPLHGVNQENLGTVSDFLVDPASGRVHYALVPSGGGTAGETFRLVPMAALDPSSGPNGLNLRIDQAQWNQVGTMIEQRLAERVTLSADEQQRIEQQFGVAAQQGQPTATGELVRATSLRGKTLRSGNDEVGTIEDVAIDLRHRTAAALLKSSAGFTGAEQNYLVPLSQLQLSDAAGGAIMTTLDKNDFQQAQAMLTPTGFTGAPFTRGGAPIQAAVAAVQQVVQQQGATGTVQVTPETWLILRGTVDSEQKKTQIQQAAQQAAPGVPIDNKITVQP